MSIYDFTVKNKKDEEISLSKYQGKVLLIVNTATKCGFTPQYQGLQELYQAYQAQGFEILDFPCNQFGKQAPEDNEGIDLFCSLKYRTTFPRFSKIDVNGKNADPLYVYLKKQQKGSLGSSIKWNFSKFLIDKEGNVVSRFGSVTKPEAIKKDIEALLAK
jgi:glutathione peroxidase